MADHRYLDGRTFDRRRAHQSLSVFPGDQQHIGEFLLSPFLQLELGDPDPQAFVYLHLFSGNFDDCVHVYSFPISFFSRTEKYKYTI